MNKHRLLLLTVTGTMIPLLTLSTGVADDTVRASRSREIAEAPDDDHINVPPGSQATSPAYRYSTRDFFLTQVNIDVYGENIVGDAANEPSIAVDPADPDRMAIGWRQFDTIESNFRQAGWGYSADGGDTWTFAGRIEPGVFRSDPVLDSDSRGNFYYNSLTVSDDEYRCDVFTSVDGGMTWDDGTYAYGGDKQWMVIDKTGGIGDGHIYCYWKFWFSVCQPGYFSRSTNSGAWFEECDSIPADPFERGTLAVGPDGELYAFGSEHMSSSFVVAKSSNARDASQEVAWDFSTFVDLDGYIGLYDGPNPGGMLGQAWIAVDHSEGPSRGNVYALCSVERNSVSDPLDVMFARSTDGGIVWSDPIRINDDPDSTAWQWFNTLSVAPDGRIDVIWLDTRDDPGGYDSALYYSFSTDAGLTWSPNERLTGSFDPHVGWPQQEKLGDYFDMVSDENAVHIACAGTFNGEQDVYYGRITRGTDIGDSDYEERPPVSFSLSQNVPNPFNPSTTISFAIEGGHGSEHVVLTIYDVRGRRVKSLIDSDLEAGSHRVHWNGRDDDGNLAVSGIYLYTLQAGNEVSTRKMTLLR